MSIKKVINNFLAFASAQSLSAAIGMINSFVLAKLLGPEILGTIRTAQLSETYSELTSLGLPFALRREIPQLQGDNDEAKIKLFSNVVFSYGLVAYLLIAIGIAISSLFIENTLLSYSLLVFSIVVFLKFMNAFGNIMAKGLNNYKLLSQIEIIKSLILLSVLPLVYLFGVNAILWGYVIVAIVTAVIYYKKIPYGYKWQWNTKILKYLLFIGLPIFFTSVSSILFNSMDKLIIASFSNLKNVGLYSVGSMISMPISLIISSSSIVVFTSLNKKYGKKINTDIVLKHIEQPMFLLSYFLPLIIGIGFLVLPIFIKTFLPNYIKGIIVGQILIIGIYFKVSASFGANALFILNKQKITAYIFFLTGSLNAILNIFLLQNNFGIKGVAFATSLSFLFYNLFTLFFVLKNIKYNFLENIQYILKLQWRFILQILLLFSVFFFYNDLFQLKNVLISMSIYIVLTSFFWIKGFQLLLEKYK